jgi:hypothetical protein
VNTRGSLADDPEDADGQLIFWHPYGPYRPIGCSGYRMSRERTRIMPAPVLGGRLEQAGSDKGACPGWPASATTMEISRPSLTERRDQPF